MVNDKVFGHCYMRQVSYTYFMIGNYNDQGERDGPGVSLILMNKIS